MRLFLFIIVLIVVSKTIAAQSGTVTLYYGINAFEVSQHHARIDSLVHSGSIASYSIIGYADFLSSNDYNQILGLKRARAVQSYLTQTLKVNPAIIRKCTSRGELNSVDNGTSEGDAGNRKVEIIIQRSTVTKKGTQSADLKNAKRNGAFGAVAEINSIQKGSSIAIEGLNFIAGRHTIVPDATRVLRELLMTMQEHPALKIEIQGHICCIDNEPDGYDYDSGDRNLSTNRAKAIYDFLFANGISESRMTYVGYGHQFPKVAIERNEKDEQQNRRVEIKVLDK